MLACRVVCYSRQSDRHIRVCISHQSDFRIRVCISHQSDFRIRICISQQSYHSIPISCTNHSVWVLFLSYFFCRLEWHRVWLICNVKRCFYWTMIFLRKMADFFSLVIWLQSISEVWTIASVLQGGFCVIIGCWGKFFWAVSRVILRILDEWKCFRCL